MHYFSTGTTAYTSADEVLLRRSESSSTTETSNDPPEYWNAVGLTWDFLLVCLCEYCANSTRSSYNKTNEKHKFLKFIFEIGLYMFRTVSLSIIRSPAPYTQHNLYDKYLLLCVRCWTPVDRQRYCPKHVESYSKNKFQKLVLLVGLVIRIYNDAQSSVCQV